MSPLISYLSLATIGIFIPILVSARNKNAFNIILEILFASFLSGVLACFSIVFSITVLANINIFSPRLLFHSYLIMTLISAIFCHIDKNKPGALLSSSQSITAIIILSTFN